MSCNCRDVNPMKTDRGRHLLTPLRTALKVIHPEGMPWPVTVLYNAISRLDILQETYRLIARDILTYSSQGAFLDIGTGPAGLLVELNRLSPDLTVTGLDASPSMVKRARKNMRHAGLSRIVTIREGNASDLPFPDASFDMVVSTGSMHHWKRPKEAFNEIFRVLTDGGYALIYDLVSDTPATIMRHTARRFGRLNMILMWVHAFEEPFYSRSAFALLPRDTCFGSGESRFVGIMYSLALQKRSG